MEILVLSRQGKGIREISRETGVVRNTLREVLRGKSDGQYGPRQPRPTKLDVHKEYLRDRLEQAGDVRARSQTVANMQRSRNARSIVSPTNAPVSLLYPCRTVGNALSRPVVLRFPFRSPSNRSNIR